MSEIIEGFEPSNKLLPCPFCGGDNLGFYHNHLFRDGYEVRCYDCHFGLQESRTKEEAIKQWNTRKPMERIVERVEEARQKYQRLLKEQGEKEDEAINILFRGMIKIVKEEGGIE